MNSRNLPQLLREAERRVNAHVWPNRTDTAGHDAHLASIPANRDTDTDLLLIEAAEHIEALTADIESGFAKGAYARLQELQAKESRYDALAAELAEANAGRDKLISRNVESALRISSLEAALRSTLAMLDVLDYEDASNIAGRARALLPQLETFVELCPCGRAATPPGVACCNCGYVPNR
jgi:hypothetical protein